MSAINSISLASQAAYGLGQEVRSGIKTARDCYKDSNTFMRVAALVAHTLGEGFGKIQGQISAAAGAADLFLTFDAINAVVNRDKKATRFGYAANFPILAGSLGGAALFLESLNVIKLPQVALAMGGKVVNSFFGLGFGLMALDNLVKIYRINEEIGKTEYISVVSKLNIKISQYRWNLAWCVSEVALKILLVTAAAPTTIMVGLSAALGIAAYVQGQRIKEIKAQSVLAEERLMEAVNNGTN